MDDELNRRAFLEAFAAGAVSLALWQNQLSAMPIAGAASIVEPGAETRVPTVAAVDVVLHLNGADRRVQLDPRVTLLDALRDHVGLTGTKKGCDHGQCGACTVHIDDRRVLSCLTLAVAAQGKAVTTIEGLAGGSGLHPMQQAFIERDAFQCGFCTPGQIMSATAMLQEPCGPSNADVRECMSGNLCRCGAYNNIVDAIQDVRRQGTVSTGTSGSR